MKPTFLAGLVAGAIFAFSASCAAQSDRVVVPSVIDRDTAYVGSCISPHGAVDLRTMLIGENDWIDVSLSDQRLRLRIEGEKLRFEYPNRVAIDPVADDLSPTGDMDIRLSFASVDGELAIYWRETYQHRMYRQGLLRIERDRTVPWCEGRGGVSDSD